MNIEQRAAIAAIIIALKFSSSVHSVYSYELSRHYTMSGNVNGNAINAFDHERSCHVSGHATSDGTFSLFDYGVSAHITLKTNGTKFSGYDYGSGYHFSGTLRSKAISLYDYQTGAHYDFSS